MIRTVGQIFPVTFTMENKKKTIKRRLRKKPLENVERVIPLPAVENFDPTVLMERTFRFKSLTEFSILYNRERARIIKLKKEAEEFRNSW